MASSGDIYQQIFNIDIAEAGGLRAVVEGETVSEAEGYILVKESESSSIPGSLLRKVVIPEKKRQSYDFARALFDNYDILSSVPDKITAEEEMEVDLLLAAIVDTAPMRLARNYISTRSGRNLSDSEWYARVRETWFRPFVTGSSPTRSGFEHVFMGEWSAKNNSVGGLHWWYFYNALAPDLTYKGAVYDIANPEQGLSVPEIATMSFTWNVGGRTLTKRIGGFLIGPSVEGLMAMGMVRAADDASPPSTAIIEGIELDFRMFKSDDRRSVNTFYPVLRRVLLGAVPPSGETSPDNDGGMPVNGNQGTVGGGLRLVSVMSNPSGNDEGREKVTLLNIFGSGDINLQGWKVRGPNGSLLVFGDVSLQRGEARTFTVPARGSLQLSNDGGTIKLLRPDGTDEQSVQYDNKVAKIQDGVLVWNGKNDMIILS